MVWMRVFGCFLLANAAIGRAGTRDPPPISRQMLFRTKVIQAGSSDL